MKTFVIFVMFIVIFVMFIVIFVMFIVIFVMFIVIFVIDLEESFFYFEVSIDFLESIKSV